LWNELRNRKLRGIKFRRQQPLGPFIVDFYAAQFKLAVEVDGPHHERSREKDLQRQRFLERQGVRFVRIPAEDIDTDLKACVERLAAALSGLM
jgi:adenine-specific DNA-methyltransferase